MKLKKIIAFMASAAMLATTLSGCGDNKEVAGKINIKVGMWPNESQTESYERMEKMRADFMAKYPDINVIPDNLGQDPQAFKLKAGAGQLPNLFKPWLTEFSQIVANGYVADITEIADKNGYLSALNPDLKDFVTGPDGKLYGLLTEPSVQGLYCNKRLFQEAGLVNEDGSIKTPSTYLEVAEYAKIIKEKTGKAGFTIATTENSGGWLFLNIAWSHGVEFSEQNSDGTWKATFDTPEMRNALQYMKDLKWKYDAVVDANAVSQLDMYQYFGTYQAGMMIANPPCNYLTSFYDMNIDDIYVTRVPEGPAGRTSQIGANVWMFSAESTPEQIDACMKWLEFAYGYSVNVSEEQLANMASLYETQISNNQIITDQEPVDIWINQELIEKTRALRQQYTNVKHENYENYYGFEGVMIKPEPRVCAQELYAIVDKCIQEVFTNPDADIDALVTTAANDFQVNHLDKIR